jgi:hypothetical protein
VLEGGGARRYKVPVSARDGQNQIFIVLRKDDQILTQSGRWSLLWRTGESQTSAQAQAIQSDGVRSFDAAVDVEDSQAHDEESSIPHDAAGNFVISMEDTGYGMPALASVLMPPPPLPRVDIILDTPEEDAGEETASEKDTDEDGPDHTTRNKAAVTSHAWPPSQGTGAALSELSTNSIIMPGTHAFGSSSAPLLLRGTPQQDEIGNLRHPDGATSALKEVADDINARKITKNVKTNEEADVVPDSGRVQEKADSMKTLEDNEEEERVRRVHFEASVAVDSHVSDSTEVLHNEKKVAMHEIHLETHANSLPLIDAGSDHESGPSTSGMSIKSLAEAGQATEPEATFLSPQITTKSSDALQPENKTATSVAGSPLRSSGSAQKRKATTSTRKENLPSKRSKVAFKQSHSDQEDEEVQSITVEVVPRRMVTVPSSGEKPFPSKRRTSRTPKQMMKSLPTSLTPLTRERSGRKPRGVMKDSTPSRSRSTSATSSTRFEEYLGSPPRVLFASSTTVDRKKDTMKDFRRLDVQVVDNIGQANMLIVGGTELKKTAKLIIAVARGMDVVNERWIVESRRKDVLLDIIPFVPEDDVHETEWAFKLVDATARGKEGLVQELLHDTTVHTTKDFDRFPAARDLPSIVKALGGNIVRSSLPYGKSRTKHVLILGTQEDSQAIEVQRIGHKLFDKDLIILGALRGKIDTESSEFEIGVRVKIEELD